MEQEENKTHLVLSGAVSTGGAGRPGRRGALGPSAPEDGGCTFASSGHFQKMPELAPRPPLIRIPEGAIRTWELSSFFFKVPQLVSLRAVRRNRGARWRGRIEEAVGGWGRILRQKAGSGI